MEESYYLEIAQAIDQGPLCAPKSGGEISRAFVAYLKLLFTPEEALVVRHLKMHSKYTPASDLAVKCGIDEAKIREILDRTAKKGAVIGFGGNYAIPPIPTILNYHQFRDAIGPDDLTAARLYQQFFIKEGYYKYYESSEKGTQVMRAIPVMRSIDKGQKVLDSEEAHRIIDAEKQLALVPCPCRTRTQKLGIRECAERNPVGACIMTGMSTVYFESLGLGKKVTHEQAKKYLDEMQDLGLVATTDNFEAPGHTVICLCCECCCSQVRGRTRWENPTAIEPSNFAPEASEDCIMCGTCVDRCFFGALSLDENAGRAVVDVSKCIGCGVCTITCDQEALKLKRVERARTFPTGRELIKKIAMENRGIE